MNSRFVWGIGSLVAVSARVGNGAPALLTIDISHLTAVPGTYPIAFGFTTLC